MKKVTKGCTLTSLELVPTTLKIEIRSNTHTKTHVD